MRAVLQDTYHHQHCQKGRKNENFNKNNVNLSVNSLSSVSTFNPNQVASPSLAPPTVQPAWQGSSHHRVFPTLLVNHSETKPQMYSGKKVSLQNTMLLGDKQGGLMDPSSERKRAPKLSAKSKQSFSSSNQNSSKESASFDQYFDASENSHLLASGDVDDSNDANYPSSTADSTMKQIDTMDSILENKPSITYSNPIYVSPSNLNESTSGSMLKKPPKIYSDKRSGDTVSKQVKRKSVKARSQKMTLANYTQSDVVDTTMSNIKVSTSENQFDRLVSAISNLTDAIKANSQLSGRGADHKDNSDRVLHRHEKSKFHGDSHTVPNDLEENLKVRKDKVSVDAIFFAIL